MYYFRFSKSPRSRQLFLTKVSSFSTILRLVSLEAFQRRNTSSLVNLLYSFFIPPFLVQITTAKILLSSLNAKENEKIFFIVLHRFHPVQFLI